MEHSPPEPALGSTTDDAAAERAGVGPDVEPEKRIADEAEAGASSAAPSGPAKPVRRRPTKLQIVVLAIVTLLALGPLIALVTIIGRDEGPVTRLLDGPPPPPDGIQVNVTVIGVSPASGEVRARIVLQLQEELSDAGLPVTDLVLRVNDVRGLETYEFGAGEPLRPIEVSLPLVGGSVTRYPFDRYASGLSMTLASTSSRQVEPVLFSYDLFSNVEEFDVGVDLETAQTEPSALFAIVELDLSRTTTTTVYAVGMMVLMWGLAIAGVMVVWALTIWQVDMPMWSIAYFVGVLFTLPQLREVLPGRPPPGTLLDFGAFYWSIAIVGVTLIATLATWFQRARDDAKALRDHPADV